MFLLKTSQVKSQKLCFSNKLFPNSQFENKLPFIENFLIKHNIDFEQKWLDCFLVLNWKKNKHLKIHVYSL